jgi:8-oxo-dGTP diphosphatase
MPSDSAKKLGPSDWTRSVGQRPPAQPPSRIKIEKQSSIPNQSEQTSSVSILQSRLRIKFALEHGSEMQKGNAMRRAPILAAGGIVLRREATPLIAVVRLRKRNEWVLPKGKLDDGETPRDAAEREVLEETGHDVSVHEFLGTLVYESGGRFKVVHNWRMEARGERSYELMDDVKAVDWLPLDAAVERLSRVCERAFLANVGPLALEAASAAQPTRQPKPRKPPVTAERRSRPTTVSPQPLTTSITMAPPLELIPPAIKADLILMAGRDHIETQPVEGSPLEVSIEARSLGVQSSDRAAALGTPQQPAEESSAQPDPASEGVPELSRGERVSLVRIVRDWLWRACGLVVVPSLCRVTRLDGHQKNGLSG